MANAPGGTPVPAAASPPAKRPKGGWFDRLAYRRLGAEERMQRLNRFIDFMIVLHVVAIALYWLMR